MDTVLRTDSVASGTQILSNPDRFLTNEGVKALLHRVTRLSVGGGDIEIWARSRSVGSIRWARNVITTAGETTDHEIQITRYIRGARGTAVTNQVDGDALQACVQRAEEELRRDQESRDGRVRTWRNERYDLTNLWSDETANLNAESRAEVQQELAALAGTAQLLSAGYLEVSAGGSGYINTGDRSVYAAVTRAEYSVTVRDVKGTGSGWAGMDNLDWRTIDAKRLSEIAVDKCQRSINPVAIEPGRYLTLLEPQAVAGLMLPLVRSLYDRSRADNGSGPWTNGAVSRGQRIAQLYPLASETQTDVLTKISQKVLDERVTVSLDPADPDMPIIPFNWSGDPVRSIRWIDQGVLRALPYDRYYALPILNRTDPLVHSNAFRMSGGPTTNEEMIASMQRGLLVTRFVNVRVVHEESLLCTGATSDGIWLIEKGKITKPVKNFRFRESPLFAFNNLVTLGRPIRVLMPDSPVIAPSALVRDFSMNSLNDAV